MCVHNLEVLGRKMPQRQFYIHRLALESISEKLILKKKNFTKNVYCFKNLK